MNCPRWVIRMWKKHEETAAPIGRTFCRVKLCKLSGLARRKTCGELIGPQRVIWPAGKALMSQDSGEWVFGAVQCPPRVLLLARAGSFTFCPHSFIYRRTEACPGLRQTKQIAKRADWGLLQRCGSFAYAASDSLS